ncbi:transposase [Streptomyces phaeochromogenes]
MKDYSDEFKADAVALYASTPGATYKSIAADLGVNRGELATDRRLCARTAAALPDPGDPALRPTRLGWRHSVALFTTRSTTPGTHWQHTSVPPNSSRQRGGLRPLSLPGRTAPRE